MTLSLASAATLPLDNPFHAFDEQPRVLVADDDPIVRQVLQRVLQRAGYAVSVVESGTEAAHEVQCGTYEAIVSDIDMPGMTGIELLKAVRQLEYDVPIILVTGNPSLKTAVCAVEYGATRYLTKPINHEELLVAARSAVKASRLAHLKRLALSAAHPEKAEHQIHAQEIVRFERALDTVWMAYQPILDSTTGTIFAYEALLRTREESFPHPGALISVAESLGRVHELGRIIRARVAKAIPGLPGNERVFVNLHPLDLEDDALYAKVAPLSEFADRVVLEITERASLSGISGLTARLSSLRELGFQTAVDDLGSGYAGLNSFVKLDPDIVKLDMTLIHGIDTSPKLQRVVGSILRLARSLDVRTVVEGVETPMEVRTLLPLGADLLQGYLFGRPQAEFAELSGDVLAGVKREASFA